MIDVDTIVRTLAPAVADLGLHVYDVEITGTGRARVVRVMVDRDGGVDLEGIAGATRVVSPLLDAPPLDALLPGPYALEVSSPGVERPLRTVEHYRRAVGETVSVKIRPDGEHGARRVRGVVTAADDSGFELELDGDGPARVGYDDVTQARTVFVWGDAATSSKRTRATSKQATGKQATSKKEVARR